jgi:hypothetical protein
MPLFHETQRYRQPFIQLIVGVMAVVGWGMFVQQIVRGKPFGDDPAPDWAVVLLTATLGVGLPALLLWMRMETDVYPDRVEIRVAPFTHRTITAGQIAGAAARTYRPLREYGGWGIRGFRSNRAYNVSGNQGVQLVLTNGNRVLIGSQQSEALEAAIGAILPG